ncbi:TIGR02285 family protein [Desulforhopalus sp. 52FAK]
MNVNQSQNQITWYRADFPPVSIPNEPHMDQGFFDKTMHFLIHHLPEYSHNFEIANFKRIMLELKQNKNVCCPSLYKTKEREQFVSFSEPAMVVLPNGLITSEKNREKLAPHIDADGNISLLSLLQDENIKLGISNGRVYSGGIDQILSQFSGKKNLLVRSGNDVFRGLINMLNMGRIDCLVGYPVEAGYFVRENNAHNDFTYYPIQESSVTYTVGHIGCPNNDWGRNIIQQIDVQIKQHRDKEFIGFYGEWLDETTKTLHKQMAEEFFNSLQKSN